jgi:hypothetical protein
MREDKITGAKVTALFVDEAGDISQEQWEALGKRVRCQHQPKGKPGTVLVDGDMVRCKHCNTDGLCYGAGIKWADDCNHVEQETV